MSDYKLINIEMTSEHFERSIKGSPLEAIKEQLWNACDADASNIEVSFGYDGFSDVESISDIYIKDNGHGINFEKAEEYFGKYGRSQKTYQEKSPKGRVYHGKLGQGRYKSFSLGNSIEWATTFLAADGKYYSYSIEIDANTRQGVKISGVSEADVKETGTIVHIYSIPEDKRAETNKLANSLVIIPELLATFAPYLLAYNDIKIQYNGVVLNPDKQIKYRETKEIKHVDDGQQEIVAKLVVIIWEQTSICKQYLCGASGVVYDEVEYTPLKKASASIYLLSNYIERMHRENTLSMGMVDPVYAFFNDEARAFFKEICSQHSAEDAAAEIERLKEEGVYPYINEPCDEIGKAEQSVFDILAVQVNQTVPQLKSAASQTKKLTYRLMREAINTNPSSIKTILTEVFNLSKEKQDELAELLTHTHLPEIIETSKIIGNRLAFVSVLEQVIYNDSVGKPIKERTQFHKLLLKELWVFGEKYALLTSDKSLKNLLVEHIKCLGREELVPAIPADATNDLTRIPDICLFNQVCLGYEQYEHLVIELKRPTKVLTKTEVDQIMDYALKVGNNALFDKTKTRWHFILLGKEVDSFVDTLLHNKTEGPGNYWNSTDGSISISILRWSSVIQENKFKYEFLRNKLNYQISEDPNFTMDYLMEKHAELFPGK